MVKGEPVVETDESEREIVSYGGSREVVIGLLFVILLGLVFFWLFSSPTISQ